MKGLGKTIHLRPRCRPYINYFKSYACLKCYTSKWGNWKVLFPQVCSLPCRFWVSLEVWTTKHLTVVCLGYIGRLNFPSFCLFFNCAFRAICVNRLSFGHQWKKKAEKRKWTLVATICVNCLGFGHQWEKKAEKRKWSLFATICVSSWLKKMKRKPITSFRQRSTLMMWSYFRTKFFKRK